MALPAPAGHLCDAARQSILDYRAGIGEDFEGSALAYAHGQALRLAGDPAGAQEWWIAALDAPTAQPWPWLMNALVALAVQSGTVSEVDGALAARAAAHPTLWLWRGTLLRQAQRPSAAVPCLRTARMHLDGALARAAGTELLHALAALQHWEAALELCAELGDSLAEASAIGILCRLGRADAALRRADRLVEHAPELAEAWLNRAAAQLHLGAPGPAEQSLQRCLMLSPTLGPTVDALRARHAP